MSFKSYMEECAEDHERNNNQRSYDAIMMAIDDPSKAKRKYRDCKIEIDNALNYARTQMRTSGYQ